MAVTVIPDTAITVTKSFVRKVEERTFRTEIFSHRNDLGVAGFYALIYREWVEYHDGEIAKVVNLPTLRIPITADLYPLLGNIANTLDAKAAQAKKDGTWPLDEAGETITFPE